MRVSSLYCYPVKSLGGQSVQTIIPEGRGFKDDRRWMFVEENGQFISCRAVPGLLLFSAEVAGDELRFTRLADGALLCAVAGARCPQSRPGRGPQEGNHGRIEVTVWDDTFLATLVDVPKLDQLTETLGIPGARLVYMGPEDIRPVDPRYARAGEEVSFADGYPYLITNTASLDDLAQRLGETSLDERRFRPNIVVSTDTPWAEDDWTSLQIGSHRFRLPKPCARCIMVTIEPETGEKDLRVLAELSRYRKEGNKVMFGMNGVWEGGEGSLETGDEIVATASAVR